MAPPDPEPPPETAPADAHPQPHSSPGQRRAVPWGWLVVAIAAVLGALLGLSLAVRGRSLDLDPGAATIVRPTFVIVVSASPRPAASPSPADVASPVTPTVPVVSTTTPASGTTYVVQPGDTLRSIAQDVYGDADQWQRIYDANRQVIGADPDSLQAGTRLQLP